MSVTRSIWSVIVVSCLSISPCAKAALEIAAKKASTSIGLAKTAANAWALETDPAITESGVQPAEEVPPPLSSYFFLNGVLQNNYDTSQYTLAVNPDTGLPDLTYSVEGMNTYTITGFEVDYFAYPNGNTDPGGQPDSYTGGYPNIKVALTPTNNDPTASTVTFDPDADGNLPDINLPVGEIDDITFILNPVVEAALNSGDDTGVVPVTMDQYFFQVNLTGPGDAPNNPGLNTASGGPNGMLTLYDPGLNPDDPDYESITTDINPSQVPEPASMSLLAVSILGLCRRRSR
jgi:hypothetical protein